MRKVLPLLGALFFLSLGVSAQDRVVTLAPPSPAASPAPPQITPYSDFSWQLAFGYQYNRINLTGKPFNTEGFDISGVRFLGSWFGLEAEMADSFGNTHNLTVPPNLDVKPLLVAGGVHLAHRGGRVEPWVHALIGGDHFRFTQSAGVYGANFVLAWDGGAGIDFHLNPRLAIRGDADYLGTHFNGSVQRNFQAGAGIVFSF
jgi:Outer membrane protein beta-barrel domain